MSLSDRIAANRCLVRSCARARVPDSDVCSDDLNAKWRNLLARQDDGTYLRKRELPFRVEWPMAA